MVNAGIHNANILIVHRSLEPADKRIIIAVLDGELTVKSLRKKGDKAYLVPENDEFEVIEITDGMDCEVWGVVVQVIHKV